MRTTTAALLLGATIALAGTGPALAGTPRHPVAVTWTHTFAVAATASSHPFASPSGPASSTPEPLQTGCRPAASPPGPPAGSGEGILSVTMSAPGTGWADPLNTSVDVELSVDGRPAQQVVLFGGATPFRYEGFVGGLGTGTHCVAVTVRPDLSHVTTAAAGVDVYAVALGVVPAGSSDYLLESHAPVLYGRSTSAAGDTPLLTYGERAPDPDGVDTDLSYTVVWTHEDVGDGVVPAYEWGLWGRMTDIETVLHEKVAPDGHVVAAGYLSCGCEPAPVYPDTVPEDPLAGGETYKAYPATGGSPGLSDHLGIRDATGNNDISPTGTTSFRFQQAPVQGPAPDQAREVAMDSNPWTYRVSDEELAREAQPRSTDPTTFLAGEYPQYLVVDIDSRPQGTGSVGVAVQLGGGAWYSNDYQQATPAGVGTTFPFYHGGHERTVIKLPPDWHSSPITALQLRLYAASPGIIPSLAGAPAIQLIEVTPSWSVVDRPVPPPQVVASVQVVPSSLGH